MAESWKQDASLSPAFTSELPHLNIEAYLNDGKHDHISSQEVFKVLKFYLI